MLATVIALVAGAVFGTWTHWKSGSGGWSDTFVRRD